MIKRIFDAAQLRAGIPISLSRAVDVLEILCV